MTPPLEGLPTKAKEAPSPHGVRLAPLDTSPVFQRLGGKDEIIDKSKLFEEQIKLWKTRKGLKGYWPCEDYDDKELKSKYFKIQLANMSDDIDEKLFETILGQTFIKLADKLINTIEKKSK